MKYYLGLDGGTSSLGWAVTDENYKVVKKSGKSLWGVRLFKEGQTAEERRLFRSSRRRNGRKKWRLKLLHELFAEEIDHIDPNFFMRLAESKYWEDDKRVDGTDALFHDKDYTDKDYHSQFPTIYHLRNELIQSDQKHDLRLIYLAIAHILKHRGHFLNEGLSVDDLMANSLSQSLFELKNGIEEVFDFTYSWKLQQIEEFLMNPNLSKSDKKRDASKLEGISSLDKEHKQLMKSWIALISGSSMKITELFPNVETEDNPSVCFEKVDDDIESLQSVLSEEEFELIKIAQSIYNSVLLKRILPEGKSFSEAKVDLYNSHSEDLKLLKEVVKEFKPTSYANIFRSETPPHNYCHYVGSVNAYGQRKNLKHCTQDDFYTFLKKELKDVFALDDPRVKDLKHKIDIQTFLPLLRTKDNSSIPYQIHLAELKKILKNATVHYSFLQETDENGLSVQDKVIMLMEFKIPYFVGPLNTAHQKEGTDGFCWVKKKKDVPITPFNFKEVVDEEESENSFIERMKSTCTYLLGESVLPKDSLLYSRFMVLNELNNLKINQEKISVPLKQQIYEELFEQKGVPANELRRSPRVTKKMLMKCLKANGYKNVKEEDVSGIDGDFKANLRTELEFRKIFPNEELDEKDIEKCIFNLTISGDDRAHKRQRIEKVLGDKATKDQIKAIAKIPTSQWGRLSEKFLSGITYQDPKDQEIKSIIKQLWETNNNLMELLADDKPFSKMILDYNQSISTDPEHFSYESLVKNLYVSPAIKRSIWQTIKVVEEVKKILGEDPEKIFIEMARGASKEQKNKRTVSRKQQLDQLYNACKKEIRELDLEDVVNRLNSETDSNLRSKKLYLYYQQQGRCAYSNEKIDLNDLLYSKKYDIDHIYPQSKTKDDSIDNLVLVKSELNQKEKRDSYPIPAKLRQPVLWKRLHKQNFISQEKYNRLMRNTPLTSEELAGFINRQLVETRQSTKATAEILKQIFPNSTIVYVKAGLPSDFRKEFGITKCRDLNDLHHAKDAYLNIVTGNVYYELFTNNPMNFVKSREGQNYTLNTEVLFKKRDLRKNGQTIWEKGDDGSLSTVIKQINRNDILVTRMCVIKGEGLFNQNPLPRGKGKFPLKGSDERLENIDRYGGYSGVGTFGFALIKSVKNNQFEFIELSKDIQDEYLHNHRFRDTYLSAKAGKEVSVVIPLIRINTLFKFDGQYLVLAGNSGNQLVFNNAVQLILKNDDERYLKRVLSLADQLSSGKTNAVNSEVDAISETGNLALYDTFIEKLKQPIFGNFGVTRSKQLQELRPNLSKLSLEDQVKALTDAFLLFTCNAEMPKLKLLNGSTVSRIRMTKNIKTQTELKIINQSVTGFFQSEVDLLKL